MRLKEEILMDEAREMAAVIYDMIEVNFPDKNAKVIIMSLKICKDAYEKKSSEL